MTAPVRQLTAIMFTDIVGYTALMNSDEDQAYDVLRLNRKSHQENIAKFNGKLLKEMGDGILASFPSTTDAVNCALAIQQDAIKLHSLKLRIGIHLGEVLVEEEDIIGDGVNIASRIESIAKPGSIYVSEAVGNSVKNKQGINVDYVGEKKLKNVAGTVRVFEVSNKGDESDRRSIVRQKNNSWILIGLTLIGIIVLGSLIGYFVTKKKGVSLNEDSEKSLAVLPFKNLSSDEVNQYFTDGVMAAIHSHLSKINDLKVISITSTEKFRNTSSTVPEIGDELQVSHLVEGSVQKFGDNYRISINLIDAELDERIWTDEYSMKLEIDQLLNAQTEIASNVIGKLQANLTPVEYQQINYKPTSSLNAYEYYLLGKFHSQKIDNRVKERQLSIEYYKKAINEDPEFSEAYAGIADSYSVLAYFLENIAYIDSSRVAVEKSLAINPDLPEALSVKAYILRTFDYEWEESRRLFVKAIELDPNNSNILRYYSLLLSVINDLDSALSTAEKAVTIDPLSPPIIENLGRIHYFRREYKKALQIYVDNQELMTFSRADAIIEMLLIQGDTLRAIRFALDSTSWLDEETKISVEAELDNGNQRERV